MKGTLKTMRCADTMVIFFNSAQLHRWGEGWQGQLPVKHQGLATTRDGTWNEMRQSYEVVRIIVFLDGWLVGLAHVCRVFKSPDLGWGRNFSPSSYWAGTLRVFTILCSVGILLGSPGHTSANPFHAIAGTLVTGGTSLSLFLPGFKQFSLLQPERL